MIAQTADDLMARKRRPLAGLIGSPPGEQPMVQPPAPGTTGQPPMPQTYITPPAPGTGTGSLQNMQNNLAGGPQTFIQPKAPAGQPPAAPNTAISTYGPGNDLIDKQITPTGAPLPAFTGVGAPQSFTPSADTSKARDTIGQGLDSLVGAPNRQKIAEDSYAALERLDRANEAKDVRGVGQRNAALGRLGSGMVNDELGDVYGLHDANLANIKAQLAKDTAGAELGDRQSNLRSAQDVYGQFSGDDYNQAGVQQGLRNEARGERSDYLNDASNRRSQDRSDRSEYRTERDFQTGRSDKAVEDAIRQRLTEEDLLNSKFGRDQKRAAFDADIAGQNQANAGASEGAIMDLIREWMRTNQGKTK